MPAWALEQALHGVVDWYEALREGADMRAVTLAQIAAFEGAAARG